MIRKFALITFLTATSAALATTYPGNGGTGFGGPVGGAGGSLTFTDDHSTLSGTITLGNGQTQLSDELVIYIDSTTGGFTSTASFTDTGGGGDIDRKAISGFDGGNRATVNFAPGFAADYAIALSPVNANFGGLWVLDNTNNFTFLTSVNLQHPTSSTYTFSLPISDIIAGLPTDFDTVFNFSTTYLNSHNDIYRSNEAYNALAGTPGDVNGNFARNTVTASFLSYDIVAVPEPSTWATAALMSVGLAGSVLRRVRRAS